MLTAVLAHGAALATGGLYGAVAVAVPGAVGDVLGYVDAVVCGVEGELVRARSAPAPTTTSASPCPPTASPPA